MCREYVSATAHADYGGTARVPNIIAKIRDIVLQEFKLRLLHEVPVALYAVVVRCQLF